MTFHNQLARYVDEIWRWKKIIIYETSPSITRQLFNLTLQLIWMDI